MSDCSYPSCIGDEPSDGGCCRVPFTSAMAEAAERYWRSVGPSAHPLPAQFRWVDCCSAMLAAAPAVAPTLTDDPDALSEEAACRLHYRGNSIRHAYDKLQAYRNALDECFAVLREAGAVIDGKTHLKDYIRAIADRASRAVAAAQPVAWIPVSARLPEEGQSVAFVVSCKNPSYDYLDGMVLGGIYRASPFGGFGVPGLTIGAAHWMPLPPAPATPAVQAEPPKASADEQTQAARDEEISRLSTMVQELDAKLAEYEQDAELLNWLERHLFEPKWNGVVGAGSRRTWSMRGDYRHTVGRMSGWTFREAIRASAEAAPETNNHG